MAAMIMACTTPQPPGDAVAGTYNGNFIVGSMDTTGNCVITKINDNMVSLVANPDGVTGGFCDSITVTGTGPYAFTSTSCFSTASVNGNTLTWESGPSLSFTGTK